MRGSSTYFFTSFSTGIFSNFSKNNFRLSGSFTDFITKKVTTVTNDSYITAVQVIELMKKLLEEYPGEAVKIVLDNAKCQQCKLVKMFALLHGIELVFLPAYPPNLNLIERLWKFVKSEVLNAAYYGSFDIFKNTIDSCISKTGTEIYPALTR